ncbi:ShlB/FhaC/HecB family hemolysin secretion/activation protein [Pseudomonas sp. CC120222-01a]|uniref:ShlB/FhaC/HecB family hemolysin secretion/activation protein n=1 Tax=Pseudomonas sp. CC120222-01a TaxID=1378075 RepID=UPI000D97A4A3|nr:POTRA domain-containing protein [Pseudomonas sp. CC120222-01a]PVZ43353.1 hemolysin activation/secretion protein [Pseudomonas sp. CC120222-01a]
MRLLLMPLLLSPWASLVIAEPLPVFLDGHEYERRLPSANLPIEAYRSLAPSLQLAPPRSVSDTLPMETRFVLHKVRFEGGTVYPLSELREHYQPLIGREVSVGELQQFTERLTRRYQLDGYLLSLAYLPDQDFAEGRVHVVLVEGYVHNVRREGDIGPAGAYLDQLLERLRAERPLTQATLDRFIGLAQRIPGVTLQADLTQAEHGEGAAQLTVHALRKPFDAAVAFSDGSREGPQGVFKVSSNAQTRFAEQLTASVLLPPGDDHTEYQRLDYSQHLDAQGSQLLLSAARYRSEPRTAVPLEHGSQFFQRIESERYAIGLGQPVIVTADEWLAVTGHVYSVSEHDEDLTSGLGHNDTYVRALSFEGDWRKVEGGRLRMVSAGVYQGLDYLGARSDADYDMDFLRFRVAGLQSDRLFQRWQGVLSGALYWTDDRLPASERAVFGGQNFGHGYPKDQAAGDKGWGVAYELNYSIQPGAGWVRLVQPYALLDAAQAWYNGGPFEDARMRSAALGVRLGDGRYGNVALEVAKPLADVALDSMSRGPRWTVSFSYMLE